MEIAIILKAPSLDVEVKEKQIIYADAGYTFKDKLKGKTTLAVVGDFDSLGAPPENEKVVGLEVEKNFTDGERAVRLAKELGANGVTIYGAFGGKIEHILGNIALLKIAKEIGLNAKIESEAEIVYLIDKKFSFTAKQGATVSLIPYGNKCKFKRSSGLYYPLKNLTLTNADTRGISNQVTQETVTLIVSKGEALLIIRK